MYNSPTQYAIIAQFTCGRVVVGGQGINCNKKEARAGASAGQREGGMCAAHKTIDGPKCRLRRRHAGMSEMWQATRASIHKLTVIWAQRGGGRLERRLVDKLKVGVPDQLWTEVL